MKRASKNILWAIGVLIIACLALLLVCNQLVVNNAKGKVFSDMESIKPENVGLLLGTTSRTRFGGMRNQFFEYRIDTAERLYREGKIKTILISGDEDSLNGENEVVSMRDSLVVRGVKEDDIILDGKGFRTLESVVRAVKVYDIHSFIVISQKFHIERAIYLAEHLGLDVHGITGFNAANPKSKMTIRIYIREYFARVKMFVDILASCGYKDRDACILNKEKQHIFHTYYGDIDTDTLPSITDDDGLPYYIVKVEKMDEAVSDAIGLEGAYFVDFFKPSDESYFRMVFGSDGGRSEKIYYDPYKEKTIDDPNPYNGLLDEYYPGGFDYVPMRDPIVSEPDTFINGIPYAKV